MASRFVQPESRKLDLSEGDWILVKYRLTAGEERAAFLRSYVENSKGEFVMHPGRLGLSMVSVYLLDWSLTDGDGHQVVIRSQPITALEETLNALAIEDFNEIRRAIEAHEQRVGAERAAQKKTRAGATVSETTSALRSDPDGALALTTSATLTPTTVNS
jgi:hypothetical protein